MAGAPDNAGNRCPGRERTGLTDAAVLRELLCAACADDDAAEREQARKILDSHLEALPPRADPVHIAFQRRRFDADHWRGKGSLLDDLHREARRAVKQAFYLSWRRGRGRNIPPRMRHVAIEFDPAARACVGPLLAADFLLKVFNWFDEIAEPGDVPYLTNAHEIRMRLLLNPGPLVDAVAPPEPRPGPLALLEEAPVEFKAAIVVIAAACWGDDPAPVLDAPQAWGLRIDREALLNRIEKLAEQKAFIRMKIDALRRETLRTFEWQIEKCDWLLARPQTRLARPDDGPGAPDRRAQRLEKVKKMARKGVSKRKRKCEELFQASLVQPTELADVLRITEQEATKSLERLQEWLKDRLGRR